jgi:hypothetical protein
MFVMNKCLSTLVLLLIISGSGLPAFATDFIITECAWGDLTKSEQDDAIKDLTRRGMLKRGQDRVIYKPDNNGLACITRGAQPEGGDAGGSGGVNRVTRWVCIRALKKCEGD